MHCVPVTCEAGRQLVESFREMTYSAGVLSVYSARCTLSQNHQTDGRTHEADHSSQCHYDKSRGNCIFLCRVCMTTSYGMTVVNCKCCSVCRSLQEPSTC